LGTELEHAWQVSRGGSPEENEAGADICYFVESLTLGEWTLRMEPWRSLLQYNGDNHGTMELNPPHKLVRLRP
jgi:hypothetical protein